MALVIGLTYAEPGPDGPASDAEALRDRFEVELAAAYPREVPEGRLTRTYSMVAAPTTIPWIGDRPLAVWAYDGQVPGPILRVRLGETLEVTLRNELPQPTTIHWHGVRVPNAMDGVPAVTQPPIPSGQSFVYRFTPKDAGTFWFHPHVRGAEQVERGLYGVLIVDDPEPLPYSRDVVWVLDDWRLTEDGSAIDPRFVTRGDLAHDGRWGAVVTVNGPGREELAVRPGERIRLRLVNPSNGRVYRPDFSALDARVIAVDGMYTARPLPPESFVLSPGNRLDLDITVRPDQRGETFPIIDRFTRRPYRLATVRVEDAPAVPTPEFEPPRNPDVPEWKGATGMPVDVLYALNARRGPPYGVQWTINDRIWGEHRMTELEPDRWVRVRFENESYRLHPMHLHGQFFKVLARNDEPVDEPYFRDTVLLRRLESVDVGMVPIDWGRWAMHCHILEHAEAGMMTLVDVPRPEEPAGEDAAPGAADEGAATVAP